MMVVNNRDPLQLICKLEAFNRQQHRYTIGGLSETLSMSIGCVDNQEQLSFDDSLKYANMCMYLSKKQFSSQVVQLDSQVKKQIDNTFALFDFIKCQQQWTQHLYLVFQQQWDVNSEAICVESLLRLDGLPFDHVALLTEIENRDQAYLLDIWVLEQVLEQHKLRPDIEFSVNAFPSSFCQVEYLQRLSQLSPSQRRGLLFEITEQQANCFTAQQCQAILATGVRLSIDDFGVGFTNLDLILRLHPEEVKLDASFMRKDYQQDALIGLINALLTLGTSLGFTLTVEGIETRDNYQWLKDMGVSKFQGYLFSKPNRNLAASAMAFDDLDRCLKE
ncbi:EAL domain-containing protein [Shewanella sp. SNU WT4]|uniref:EAL domain-containing protein n=1 Tax=Shewanella sp. SNU WT4 TaxID=2590015 RepID=UPI00112B8715|nr:EAL domain-containing protein [Shewanella sp. SNU WT4]QDF67267.1 EAL domain-containing protein [Shewanella sp. SNU WT4]